MRQTNLQRTILSLLIIFIGVAVVFGVLRNTVVSQPNGHESHQHAHDDGHGSQDGLSGAALFKDKGCTQCHHPDSSETKVGPGLQSLFEQEKLPVSGRPVTEEHVKEQLREPYANMPSYADRLTPQEENRIIIYLKTL